MLSVPKKLQETLACPNVILLSTLHERIKGRCEFHFPISCRALT